MLMVMAQPHPIVASEIRTEVIRPISAVTQANQIRVAGQLEYIDLEGGFYSVDGWGLIGEDELFKQYLGQAVIIVGTPFEGMSIQMVKSITVSDIYLGNVEANPVRPVLPPVEFRTLPAGVTVDGKPVVFDQAPVITEGIVMVPLRAVVTAAGGSIEWIESDLTARVEYNGRTIDFIVGSPDGNMSGDGRLQRVAMTQAPQLIAGRVLVSTDALTGMLGLGVSPNQVSSSLELSTAPIADLSTRLYGVIQEIELGEKPRVLIAGGRMSNGEPNLTWVYVQDTKIILESLEALNGAIEDLKVGQAVEALITGPMNMSYPALAKADELTVKTIVNPSPEEEDNWMTGSIQEIQQGTLTRILVAGGPMMSGEPTLVWFTISSDTIISIKNSGETVPGNVADLCVGQKVEVLSTGPMLMSYPAQGGAATIIINP